MQEYIEPFLYTLIAGASFYKLGQYVILRFDKERVLCGHELTLGFSIAILFLSIYFVLPIKMSFLASMYFGAFIFILTQDLKKIINVSNFNLINLIAVSIPLIFFLFYSIFYGSNFITFRGNIWDWFNYNTMAVSYGKYSISEFTSLIEAANPVSYIAFANINQRPFVVALPSAILSITKVDSFSLMYFYKGLLLTILLRGYQQFLLDIGYDRLVSTLISLSFIFSSWIFYVVETDALSYLAFLAFTPTIISILIRFNNFSIKFPSIPIALFLAAYFCIYPEFAIICYAALFLVLAKTSLFLYIESQRTYLKDIGFTALIFFLVILVYWNHSVIFLFKQIIGGVSSREDWWGYFGGFLFGPNSPVINPDIVSQVRAELINNANPYQSDFLLDLLKSNLIFILPSVFGLFHLLSINFLVIPSFIVSTVIASVFIGFLFQKTRRLLWLKYTLTIIIILMIYLLVNGAIWGAVKGLSYLMVLIPIVLAVTLKRIKVKPIFYSLLITFVFAPLFSIYKYSEYNGGIGRYDGFPSVLKKESKLNHKWDFSPGEFENCKLINISIDDPFVRHFTVLKLENANLPYQYPYSLRESYGVGRFISNSESTSDNFDCEISQ